MCIGALSGHHMLTLRWKLDSKNGHVTFTKPMMSHTGLIYDVPYTPVLLWVRLIHWDCSLAPSTGMVLDLSLFDHISPLPNS